MPCLLLLRLFLLLRASPPLISFSSPAYLLLLLHLLDAHYFNFFFPTSSFFFAQLFLCSCLVLTIFFLVLFHSLPIPFLLFPILSNTPLRPLFTASPATARVCWLHIKNIEMLTLIAYSIEEKLYAKPDSSREHCKTHLYNDSGMTNQ
jgi:hypothetical protein